MDGVESLNHIFLLKKKNKIINFLDKDPNCNEKTLKEIFNYLKIDSNKFEKCLMKDIFKINTLEDQQKFVFPKNFQNH